MENTILNNSKYQNNVINMKHIKKATLIKLKYLTDPNKEKKLRIFGKSFVKKII
jgi:hypothetical protein